MDGNTYLTSAQQRQRIATPGQLTDSAVKSSVDGLGLSTGGVALLATLAASASYIAAPTAMRIAVPQANAALSITAALGITFPFNIVVGIPLYIALAQRWTAA